MQTITYFIAMSLDGSIARADGSYDFFVAEGEHLADYVAKLHEFDSVVMGRRTYEVGSKVGVMDPYPFLRSYVVSTTLPPSTEPNVTVVSDGVALVRSLREADGRGVYLCGGSDLAGRLLAEGLVDEVHVKIHPVLVGGGIPLTPPHEATIRLELLGTKVFATGVVNLHYRVMR